MKFRANKVADKVDRGELPATYCCTIMCWETNNSGTSIVDCSGKTEFEAVLLASSIAKHLNETLG